MPASGCTSGCSPPRRAARCSASRRDARRGRRLRAAVRARRRRGDHGRREALATAREAAGGLDVRIGGGPATVRDFVAAGLVDQMHVVVVPILLGRGVRLWDGLEEVGADFEIEATSSPSGVTHVTFTRAGA